MDKRVLKLKPKEESAIAPPQPAIPSNLKPPENPVERGFINRAIQGKRPVRFQHPDGSIAEGIPVSIDRYTIELEGAVILWKHGLKLMQLLPLKE